MNRTVQWLSRLFLLVAVVAYFLPWAAHSTAGLASGARDLAEWTTLYPPAAPAYQPSLYLRLSLGLLAVLLLLQALEEKSHLLRGLFIGLPSILILLLVPPIEYFYAETGNLNYRQQFTISGVTLFGGLSVFPGRRLLPELLWRALPVAVSVCTLGFGIAGTVGGVTIMRRLGVITHAGSGSVLFAGALLGFCLLSAFQLYCTVQKHRVNQ